MKRISVPSNYLPKFIKQADTTLLDKKNSALESSLAHFKNTNRARGGVEMQDYVYDMKEYPSGIKKLYIQGEKGKKAPKQILNLVTNSFTTNPTKFLSKYDIDFKEF